MDVDNYIAIPPPDEKKNTLDRCNIRCTEFPHLRLKARRICCSWLVEAILACFPALIMAHFQNVQGFLKWKSFERGGRKDTKESEGRKKRSLKL